MERSLRPAALTLLLGTLAVAWALTGCGGAKSGSATTASPSSRAGTTGPASISPSSTTAWQLVDIGDTAQYAQPLRTLAFADSANGMTVTYTPDFTTFALVTADGGATWSSYEVPRARDAWAFNHICSPETGKAWGVGTMGSIAATADGGKTWGYQRQGVAGQELSSVWFTDARAGWAVGGQMHPTLVPSYKTPVVVHTTDGGKTWTEMRLAADPGRSNIQLLDMTFTDARTGWAVDAYNDKTAADPLGGRGIVFRTTDGGTTWQAHTFSKSVRPLHAVAAVGASHCWAVGPADTLVTTADGGATWLEGTTGQFPGAWMVSVAFADKASGWAGGDGALAHTTDGGKTWTKELAGELEVWSLRCLGDGTVMAGGQIRRASGEWAPALWLYAGH